MDCRGFKMMVCQQNEAVSYIEHRQMCTSASIHVQLQINLQNSFCTHRLVCQPSLFITFQLIL